MIATTPSLHWEIFMLVVDRWELVAAFTDSMKAANYAREQCKRGTCFRARESKTGATIDYTRRKLGGGFVVDSSMPFMTEVAR